MTSSPAPAAASQEPVATRLGQQRLGGDADEALHEQRRGGQQAARVLPRPRRSRPAAAAARPSTRPATRRARARPSRARRRRTGTTSGASAPGATTASSRATSTATSLGARRRTEPTAPRGTPVAEQRPAPVDEHEIDVLAVGELGQVPAGVGRGEAPPRAPARRARAARARTRSHLARDASASWKRSVCSPPRTAAPRGGSMRRAMISSRGGSEVASGSASASSCASAASVCGATRIDCSGIGIGVIAAVSVARAIELGLDRLAEARCPDPGG